jgi:hypothetical protein
MGICAGSIGMLSYRQIRSAVTPVTPVKKVRCNSDLQNKQSVVTVSAAVTLLPLLHLLNTNIR